MHHHPIPLLAAAALPWAAWLAFQLGRLVWRGVAGSEFAAWFRRASPPARAAALCALLAAVAIGGNKGGGSAPLSAPRPTMPPSLAVVSVRTNGVAFRAASSNAVEAAAWRRVGGTEAGVWVGAAADAPLFAIGTEPVFRVHASMSGAVTFASTRRPPVGRALPDGTGLPALCPLRAPLGFVPGGWGDGRAGSPSSQGAAPGSRFWHDALPGGGVVLTWEDALVDRLPGRRASVQAELRPSGDCVFRYDFPDALDPPATNLVIGTQTGADGVNALAILGTNLLSATVWNVDGAPVTDGAALADLLCTNGVLRTPASFEIRWRNTTGLDPDADTDGDGLTDWAETFQWGTDSNLSDTDGDGIADSIEALAGQDPLDADEDADGVPDGVPAADWAADPLWAVNAPDGAAAITVTLNHAVPAGESATLVVGGLAIPLRSPSSWTLALVPGERYDYRLFVHGDSPVDLSIGPDGGSAPPLRGPMDGASIALWLDDVGGTFDGWSLGGSGNMAIPTLNLTWDDPGNGSHDSTTGGVCLHGGTEAVFTPILRPSGIHGRWLLEGLSERDGGFVLAVPDIGVVHGGAATLFTGKLRFGVVQSVVSVHRCDSSSTSPYCSVCGCYMPLDLSIDVRSPLTLKHDNQTPIAIIHAHSSGESHESGRIFIRRKDESEWLPLGREGELDPWTAKIAGTFELRGRATVDGRDWITPIVEIEVRFPSYDDVVGDDTVMAAMSNAWQKTKNDCTELPNLRREVGFWIQLNTTANHYIIGRLIEGPLVGPSTNASVRLLPQPADSDDWPDATEEGAIYTIGAFHTHTPRTYLAPLNRSRWVGPSNRDYTNSVNRQIIGIVYDYVGVPDPGGNSVNRLYNGHPKDAPARLYPVPPERRPTP